MAYDDDFVHVLTGPPPSPLRGGGTTVSEDYFTHSHGQQALTEALIVSSIRKKHPKHHLVITLAYLCDILSWAQSRDDVICTPHGDPKDTLIETSFQPPARRYGDSTGGSFLEHVSFGAYDVVFNGNVYLVYIVNGTERVYPMKYNYVLVEASSKYKGVEAQERARELVAEASKWVQALHGEVLVFDGGYWQKNKELYENIQKANWADVILSEERKESIIEDVVGFFESEKRYTEFGVPWKRGLIFYGPPGNGKTISTKALMHDLSKRTTPKIETLYIKSLNSYQGPEIGVRNVFLKARQMAPCLLIFEDIDALISPMVRSYFLNEVDGLESNHGILMIGSTNHLERLDPGIAKRPSRFDRKYLFDVPDRAERVQYCEYWRQKLRANKELVFPEVLSGRVADLTADFSFAYMKEAFVAALLAIMRKDKKRMVSSGEDDDLSDNALWQELRKQIANLRKEMDGEDGDADVAVTTTAADATSSSSMMWPASWLTERGTSPMDIRNALPRHR